MTKPLILLAALAGAAALTACDDPNQYDDEAMTAEDAGAPVVVETAPEATAAAPSPTDAPPVDSSRLPTDSRTSEETVKPESETLFY